MRKRENGVGARIDRELYLLYLGQPALEARKRDEIDCRKRSYEVEGDRGIQFLEQ